MSRFSRFAKIAAAAVLATGIFAGSAAPATAAQDSAKRIQVFQHDTGWG